VRHGLTALDVVTEAASRLNLDAAIVARIFDETPLDFPVHFRDRLPLFAHRLGMIGITLAARVWLLVSARQLPADALIALIRHEAEHVRQQRERPILFYPRYALGYLIGLLRPSSTGSLGDKSSEGRRHASRREHSRTHRAYRSIGYEREAYAADATAREEIARALGRARRRG
jgi:hypothetical protein